MNLSEIKYDWLVEFRDSTLSCVLRSVSGTCWSRVWISIRWRFDAAPDFEKLHIGICSRVKKMIQYEPDTD
jgi:hypothetical protein